MTALEVTLLLCGICAFVVSFLIQSKTNTNEATQTTVSKELLEEMLGESLVNAKDEISEAVEEVNIYSVEKFERAVERLCNEKISAVSEYSDTVLEEIHKNHAEIMFLYDMLNDKEKQLKEFVTNINSKKIEEQLEKEVIESPLEQNPNVEENFTGLLDNVAKENFIDLDKQIKSPKVTKNAPKSSIKSSTKTAPKGATKKDTKESPNIDIRFNTDQTKDNNNVRIMELHKKGKSNIVIAKELGLGVGEVKLVIDLFKGM